MRINKKKILFIIPTLCGGGAEKVLISLLTYLDRSKYNITLCVIMNKGIYFDSIPTDIELVTIFNSELLHRVLIYMHRKINLSFILKLIIKYRLKETYRLGISFLDGAHADFLLAMSNQVIKKCVVIHSSYKSNRSRVKYLKGAYKKYAIRRYKKYDTIVSVSEDVDSEFKQVLGEFNDMRVIHNPIDKKSILEKSKDYLPNFNDDVINIVAVGSLIPVKGYQKLIEACLLLVRDGCEFKLRILGRGVLFDELQEMIHENGLEKQISLLGFKKNPYKYMSHSDIFVMSSIAEGLPTVLLEAMTLGLPSIVTNCSGCKSIVKSGEFGIMVDQTPYSIFKGLKKLIKDSELRQYYSSKSFIRASDFALENSIKSYEKLFDEL